MPELPAIVKVQTEEGAMRKALFIFFAAALVCAATAEVVAAPRKSIATDRHLYVSPANEIHVAMPNELRGFSADLLPQ